MTKLKRVGMMFLMFTLLFTGLSFNLGTDRAEAYSSATFEKGAKLKDAQGMPYQYTGREMSYMQIYYPDYDTLSLQIGSAIEEPYLQEYRVEKDGKMTVAYCVEHGVVTNTAAELTAVTQNTDFDSYVERTYKKEGKKYILDNIGLITYYGRLQGSTIEVLKDSEGERGLGFKNSKWYKDSTTYTLDDWEAATRQLIHETQQEFRDANFKLVGTSLQYQDSWRGRTLGTISKFHYQNPLQGRAAYDIYRYMEKLVQDHKVIEQKLASNDEDKPKEIRFTDEDNDGVWEARVKTTAAKAYDVFTVRGKGADKLTITLDRTTNEYLLKYSGDPDDAGTIEIKKKVQRRDKKVANDLTFWEMKTGNRKHIQPLVTGSVDPITFFLKPTKNPPKGDRPEPEYFPVFSFKVNKVDANPGFDGNTSTPMGDAELNATYVLLKDGVEVDRVTLDSYGSEMTLSDKPWDSKADFTETESGSRDHYLPGTPPVYHCTVSPTKLEWRSAPVNYEIREVRPDGRFVEPDSGVRKYTVSYYGYSDDTRTCINDPENWTEINYQITRTVTDGAPVPNEGTDTGTLAAVSDVLTFGSKTFVNDNYRGKLTLSKSLQNENVFDPNPLGGVQKDSIKSLWSLKLDSSGFENHPYVRYVKEASLVDGTAVYRVVRDNSGLSSDTDPMKVGTNGDMVIYDIPYGVYTMYEVQADDISYVLENFKVEIGEHNQVYSPTQVNDDRYDYNIRDKKKTNVIKVIKTNAETGKTVFEEGTKFYIRYKGNPLLADPTSPPHYNRFLPNAENISKSGPFAFECNANGEIVIPYEIPWGIYEIMEWNLPTGYFVGKYNASGKASSHSYGEILEGQLKALSGSNYSDLVTIYNGAGEKVKYKDKDTYAINEIFNLYIFRVEKQNDHNDGNPSQRVTADGTVTKTDPTYDKDDYAYEGYYKAVAMANNNVKGKIEVEKKGETLTGFKKETEVGKEIMKPVFSGLQSLTGAVFGIFAEEDIELNDGNLGGKLYDAETGKEILIDTEKSTHVGNPDEAVSGLSGKTYTASVYDTGKKDLLDGSKLWFVSDRSKSEIGKFLRMYISPERENTRYKYTLANSDGTYNYTYDVTVDLNFHAGGDSITKVEIKKVTEVANGFVPEIVTSTPSGAVGSHAFNPIENYIGSQTDPTDPTKSSILSTKTDTYNYEAIGQLKENEDGVLTDFSEVGTKREVLKDYMFYILKAADVVNEERVVTPAVDGNGDGDFDDPEDTHEVKETKTKFEWDHNVKLVDKTVGGKAIVEEGSGHKVYTRGYYKANTITYDNAFIKSDISGNIDYGYTLPTGFHEMPFTGTIGVDPHYVIISNGASFMVLLEDGTFTASDDKGNYQKKKTEIINARYVQVANDPDGMTLSFDGFTISTSVAGDEATTIITKPEGATHNIVLGAGYSEETAGNATTLVAKEAKAPLYYLTKDGVKTEMAFSGGMLKTKITVPQAAVGKDYDHVVPVIKFMEKRSDGTYREHIFNWYRPLSPTNPELEEKLYENVRIKAVRVENPLTGGVERYDIEVFTDRGENEPIVITYSDGYSAYLYKGKSDLGKDAGVLLIEGAKKTVRFSKGALVETITTGADGKAVSSELPLGKYYVKELSAPSEYVNSEEIKSVELKYKDQFTPLVWENMSFTNKYFEVEIDLEKGFETAFETDIYNKGAGAVFGIYTNAPITAGGKTLPKDSLVSIVVPDSTGKAMVKEKLPAGKYYIKEIETRAGYELMKQKLYFTVGDKLAAVEPKVSYPLDGIDGEITMDSYGKAEIDLRVKVRFPMPKITVDGKEFDLDGDSSEGRTTVKKIEAETMVNVKLNNSETTTITLPNGKVLTVTVNGNTFDYTLDGALTTYTQEAGYTGTYAEFTRDFTAPVGESLADKVDTFTFRGAGAASPVATVTILHKPIKKQKPVWTDLNGSGVKDPGEEVMTDYGLLDEEGNQAYTHEGRVNIEGTDIELIEGKTMETVDSLGGLFTYALSKTGFVTMSYANTLTGEVPLMERPMVGGVEADPEAILYQENVTEARTNTKSDTIQIKINKQQGGTDVEILKNRALPESPVIPTTYTPPLPPTPPHTPEIPEIPDVPEKPEIPEEPEKPEIPDVPDKPKTPQVPKTGGNSNMPFYIFLMIMSLTGIRVLYNKRD